MNPQGQALHEINVKASPHSSGNSHGGLYATMPAEDALGTAWHGRAACEKAAQTQGPYPLPMHCGIDKGFNDKK